MTTKLRKGRSFSKSWVNTNPQELDHILQRLNWKKKMYNRFLFREECS